MFGSVSRKQRLMYAGLLLQPESAAKTLQTAAIQSTIAVIVAEETAMMAAVAASTAAAASAAND